MVVLLNIINISRDKVVEYNALSSALDRELKAENVGEAYKPFLRFNLREFCLSVQGAQRSEIANCRLVQSLVGFFLCLDPCFLF